jgi:hypothetical protein
MIAARRRPAAVSMNDIKNSCVIFCRGVEMPTTEVISLSDIALAGLALGDVVWAHL